MFQYEKTIARTWSEIGRMKKGRYYHAVVAVVDKSLYCPAGIVVRQIRKIIVITTIVTTILSSILPYPILYPISYRCLQNYRLYSPKSSGGALRYMQYCNIIRLLEMKCKDKLSL